MAIMTIRSTYALDPETVRRLDDVARRWGVSKSEALRRAIRAASDQRDVSGQDRLAALSELQKSLDLTPKAAKTWIRQVKRERETFGRRAR